MKSFNNLWTAEIKTNDDLKVKFNLRKADFFLENPSIELIHFFIRAFHDDPYERANAEELCKSPFYKNKDLHYLVDFLK
jgi:hypothetical protein